MASAGNEIVLRAEAQEPARAHVQEPQVAVLIDVEVAHLADVARTRVEDALLAQFLVRGLGMLVAFQPGQVHGGLPSLGR
jgi:hypothetical protein